MLLYTALCCAVTKAHEHTIGDIKNTDDTEVSSSIDIGTREHIIPEVYDFGSKFNLQQNGHHQNAPFMLITMVKSQPHISFLAQVT